MALSRGLEDATISKSVLQNRLFHSCENQADLTRKHLYHTALSLSHTRVSWIHMARGEPVRGMKMTYVGSIGSLCQMGIDTQSRSVGLGESPENVFRSLVDIRTA